MELCIMSASLSPYTIKRVLLMTPRRPKRPKTPNFDYDLYNLREMKKSIIAKTYESGSERPNTRKAHTRKVQYQKGPI